MFWVIPRVGQIVDRGFRNSERAGNVWLLKQPMTNRRVQARTHDATIGYGDRVKSPGFIRSGGFADSQGPIGILPEATRANWFGTREDRIYHSTGTRGDGRSAKSARTCSRVLTMFVISVVITAGTLVLVTSGILRTLFDQGRTEEGSLP